MTGTRALLTRRLNEDVDHSADVMVDVGQGSAGGYPTTEHMADIGPKRHGDRKHALRFQFALDGTRP